MLARRLDARDGALLGLGQVEQLPRASALFARHVEVVPQEQQERPVADEAPRAPDRVAVADRLVLDGEVEPLLQLDDPPRLLLGPRHPLERRPEVRCVLVEITAVDRLVPRRHEQLRHRGLGNRGRQRIPRGTPIFADVQLPPADEIQPVAITPRQPSRRKRVIADVDAVPGLAILAPGDDRPTRRDRPATIRMKGDREDGADEQRRRFEDPVQSGVARAQKPAVGGQQEMVWIDRAHRERQGAAHDPARVRREPGRAAVPRPEEPTVGAGIVGERRDRRGEYQNPNTEDCEQEGPPPGGPDRGH